MTKQQFPHLSDIGFQRMAPAPALRPYIQWFWSIQSNGRIQETRSEFMHADGSLGLVFNWGDELESSNGRYLQTVTLDKVTPQSKQLTLTGHVQAFGILFHPGGAYALFGIPMHELTTNDSLHVLNLTRLYEQLGATPTMAGKVALVEIWFNRLHQQAHTLSGILLPLLQRINQTHGQCSIQQIAAEMYISQRQLERVFKKQIGLSPKKYTRLIRMRYARTTLKQAQTPTLTQIAHLTGFYDQAHFNREFKATIGITPGDYLIRQQTRNHSTAPDLN